MKYKLLFFLVCSFFSIQSMQAPASVECLAKEGNALAILYIANQKRLDGNYLETIALGQRYQIRVVQDDACCIDKSAGTRAFLNLSQLFSADAQLNDYLAQMSMEKYYNLYRKQLICVEDTMNRIPLPEPYWLKPFCTMKINKDELFLNPSLWYENRLQILERFKKQLDEL